MPCMGRCPWAWAAPCSDVDLREPRRGSLCRSLEGAATELAHSEDAAMRKRTAPPPADEADDWEHAPRQVIGESLSSCHPTPQHAPQ